MSHEIHELDGQQTVVPSRNSNEGIDVKVAESEFQSLSRKFSKQGHEKSSGASSNGSTTKDIEKGEPQTDVFDLRDYLSSSNDANQQAGLKHKVSTLTPVPSACVLASFRSMWVSLGKIFKSMFLVVIAKVSR
jgi:hypothetical protein